MVAIETFRHLAVSFAEVAEQPHFEKPAFKVNKKIFATLDLMHQRAILKLTATDQSVFCAFDAAIIYPVSGGWGKQGWTVIELVTVPLTMLEDALTMAYCHVAPERLSQRYRPV